jgi:transposase
MGFLLDILITSANITDRKGGKQLLEQFSQNERSHRMEVVVADSAYGGELESWCQTACKWRLDISPTPGKAKIQKKFVPVEKRWIVERTFAWLETGRRLAKNYERTAKSAEAMVYIGMIRILSHRFA